jgi:hypothetical protein
VTGGKLFSKSQRFIDHVGSNLINTGLQSGGATATQEKNRFNGFPLPDGKLLKQLPGSC